MKKSNLLWMCSLLLGLCLFTACSDDDTTPAPVPSFPELVTKTATAGEVINLSFDANYDWVASISESTYTYFQLLTGEGENATTTKSVSGQPGLQTIRVKVAEDAIFENAPICEVTLQMNGIEQVIARITYPTSERVALVYAPVINNWGSFQSGGMNGDYRYAYEESAMTAESSVKMQWGVERGADEEAANSFYAPVKIAANFDYTVAGPAWMVAAEAGVAGVQEHIIKADINQLPAESTLQTIDILIANTETVAGSFAVEITGYNDFVVVEGFSEEYAYSCEGEAQGYAALEGFLTAADTYVAVLCDATGAAVDWVSLDQTSDDSGSVIKTYTIGATVAANQGATREAYLFFFAGNNAPTDNAMLFSDGAIKEEFIANFATKIVQYPEPATISANWVDDTCVKFAEAASDIDYWFEEGELRNLYIGSKYDICYYGQDAQWGSDSSFKTSRPVKSFKTYSYNMDWSFVELTEGSWAYAESIYTDEELTRFKILTDLSATSAEASLNYITNEYEAVILVEYTDGSYSAIYFHYGTDAGASSSDGVAFENEQYAGWANASLQVLQEGDELYDTYFAEYSSSAYPAQFYHLTYEFPVDQSMYSMVRLVGIDSSLYANPSCDWAYYDAEQQVIVMEAAGAGSANPGAVCFMNGMGVNEIVILCTLNNAE